MDFLRTKSLDKVRKRGTWAVAGSWGLFAWFAIERRFGGATPLLRRMFKCRKSFVLPWLVSSLFGYRLVREWGRERRRGKEWKE